jgi:hypothetical protein
MEAVEAGSIERDLLFFRFFAIAGDEFGIVHGHLVAGEGATDADLHAIEAEFLGERDGLDFTGETEVPVRDADLEMAFRGGFERGQERDSCQESPTGNHECILLQETDGPRMDTDETNNVNGFTDYDTGVIRFVSIVIISAVVMAGASRIPSFPGAEGAGAYASGGRGGTVFHVTNVNADGPGSLADAISAPNRIIVFDVSGTIDLAAGAKKRKRGLTIAQPNITIAGQTAPGEGICIKGGALHVTAGNIIVRYIRIRRGFNVVGDMGDAVDIKGDFQDVIFDHVSTSWATDENLTLTNANRVTAQYSIAAEGLDYFNPNQSPNRHSEGSLFGSSTPGGEMTIHHTLYAHNRLRNARTTGGGDPPPNLDFRNNVIYDWKEYATHTGSEPVHLNLVNNYYREGPSTGFEDASAHRVIFTFMKDEAYKLFASGNVLDGNAEATRDNWQAIRIARPDRPHRFELSALRSESPFATPPVTTQNAEAAFEAVLANAGATLPARDAVDLRIVNDVRNRTGAVINYESDIPAPGRWQTYHSLPGPVDSDGDGIPDYWEEQFGLDKHSAKDAVADSNGDGYMNIEKYFNNSDPQGGKLPLVYVSAAVSRAYLKGNRSGAFLVHRTGETSEPLTVRYRIDGRMASVVVLAGREAVSIPVYPEAQESVITIEPDAGYHIGCPIAAMVVREDAPPLPVEISGIDPEGGVSDKIRKIGEENMKDHKKDKAIRHKTVYPGP